MTIRNDMVATWNALIASGQQIQSNWGDEVNENLDDKISSSLDDYVIIPLFPNNWSLYTGTPVESVTESITWRWSLDSSPIDEISYDFPISVIQVRSAIEKGRFYWVAAGQTNNSNHTINAKSYGFEYDGTRIPGSGVTALTATTSYINSLTPVLRSASFISGQMPLGKSLIIVTGIVGFGTSDRWYMYNTWMSLRGG